MLWSAQEDFSGSVGSFFQCHKHEKQAPAIDLAWICNYRPLRKKVQLFVPSVDDTGHTLINLHSWLSLFSFDPYNITQNFWTSFRYPNILLTACPTFFVRPLGWSGGSQNSVEVNIIVIAIYPSINLYAQLVFLCMSKTNLRFVQRRRSSVTPSSTTAARRTKSRTCS